MKANTSRTAQLQALRTAFDRLAGRPFPDDSTDDSASVLHAELADFDGFVAGRITTLLNGGRVSAAELEADADLRVRLEALARSSAGGAEDAREYLIYLRELEALLELGRNLGSLR